MDEQQIKFVDFHKYCPFCKHIAKSSYEEPCDKCLKEPVNLFSHKPVKFEERK